MLDWCRGSLGRRHDIHVESVKQVASVACGVQCPPLYTQYRTACQQPLTTSRRSGPTCFLLFVTSACHHRQLDLFVPLAFAFTRRRSSELASHGLKSSSFVASTSKIFSASKAGFPDAVKRSSRRKSPLSVTKVVMTPKSASLCSDSWAKACS